MARPSPGWRPSTGAGSTRRLAAGTCVGASSAPDRYISSLVVSVRFRRSNSSFFILSSAAARQFLQPRRIRLDRSSPSSPAAPACTSSTDRRSCGSPAGLRELTAQGLGVAGQLRRLVAELAESSPSGPIRPRIAAQTGAVWLHCQPDRAAAVRRGGRRRGPVPAGRPGPADSGRPGRCLVPCWPWPCCACWPWPC